MTNITSGSPGLKSLGPVRRRAVSLSPRELIKAGTLFPENKTPLLIQPAVEGLDLPALAAGQREEIEGHLLRSGAILFRNFSLKTVSEFEHFVRAVSGELLDYVDQTSPRHKVSSHVYTSTDHPSDQSIFLHNENSYAYTWPLKIFFFCRTAARQGGETPIADVRKVYERIDARVRRPFEEKGWMLVRNYGGGIGLSWQTVFQTEDKAAVEDYCREAGIEAEWKDGDRLRTRQVRRAVARHPRTGETVWFNHAAFFHVTTLPAPIRESLLAQFGWEELPYNTYYGDGSAIETTALEEIREAYRRETITFPWQAGDLLMLDNMLTAHGRRPFEGPREVVVGMSEPFRSEEA
nr:Dioxygenase TauD/TfdA [uncultured bacterium]